MKIKILISFFCLLAWASADHIGLVFQHKKYPFKEKIDIVQFSTIILTNTTAAVYKNRIGRLRIGLYWPMKNIEALKTNKDLAANFYSGVFMADEALTKMEKYANILQQYKNPSVQTQPDYVCTETLSDANELYFEDLLQSIFNKQTSMKTTWLEDDLNKQENKITVENYLHDLSSDIVKIAEKMQNHLELLDSLTAGILPDELLPLLQANLQCYPLGRYEALTLEKCEKIHLGLLCNFKVEMFTEAQNYIQFIPVNYDGIEVNVGQPDFKLISQQDSTTVLRIKCNNDLNSACETYEWNNDCAQNIFSFNADLLLKHCDFILRPPSPPFKVSGGGVAIFDPKLEIKFTNTPNQHDTVVNKAPMVIFTNLVLTLKHKFGEIIFRPSKNQVREKIFYSIFNETVIANMRAKATIRRPLWTWIKDFDLIALFLHTVVFAFAIISCIVSVRAVCLAKIRRNKNEKQIKDTRKINYVKNKQRLLKRNV